MGIDQAPTSFFAQNGRRESGDEVEFVTIMRFDSLDAVRQFAGADYERSFVPPQARSILKRYDDLAQHYEHIRHIDYAAPDADP